MYNRELVSLLKYWKLKLRIVRSPEDVHGLGLRIRIYGCERMRRQRLLGEAAVSFATLNLELENSLWLQLMPRQHHQPGLLVNKVKMRIEIMGIDSNNTVFYLFRSNNNLKIKFIVTSKKVKLLISQFHFAHCNLTACVVPK